MKIFAGELDGVLIIFLCVPGVPHARSGTALRVLRRELSAAGTVPLDSDSPPDPVARGLSPGTRDC